MTISAEVDWPAARTALAEAATQVGELLRSVRDPTAPALGEWNLSELAVHLAYAFDIVPALARRERDSPIGDLSDLSGATKRFVDDDPERDLDVLAERIETAAAAFLGATASAAADDPCPWLVEGSTLTIVVLTCHLLNEAVMHGYDIAKAYGRPWKIDRTVAALIFEGFILPVFRVLDPRAMVVEKKAAGVRVRYDIRLRGAGRFCFFFDQGAVTVEAPSSRKVDCHMSADPAALLLVAWGRINQWQAITKGQLMVWGRRPWMGLRLRGLLRNL